MVGGLRPIWTDHRDYDFHKSFGSTVPASFPDSYNVDAGLWTPDQNISQAITGLPTIPPLPEGCTDYAQDDLVINQDAALYSPMLIENVTHANANGGGDIRAALAALKTLFNRGSYFNVTPVAPLDAFDAIRLAMLSTQSEKRAVSIGTPWFPEFESPLTGILPTPTNYFVARATWHNWVICGWKIIGDQPYLIGKSWQGAGYGDKGFHYVSRPLLNSLMGISGSAAFTISKSPAAVQTVDVSFIQWVVSFIRSLIGLS